MPDLPRITARHRCWPHSGFPLVLSLSKDEPVVVALAEGFDRLTMSGDAP